MKTKRNILKSTVNKVVSASGGDKLVDYASSKIAKKMVSPEVAKHVDDRTSGKQALGSAAKVGMAVASVAGAGALARGVASAVAKRGIAKAAVKKVTPYNKPKGDFEPRGNSGVGYQDDHAPINFGPFKKTLKDRVYASYARKLKRDEIKTFGRKVLKKGLPF